MPDAHLPANEVLREYEGPCVGGPDDGRTLLVCNSTRWIVPTKDGLGEYQFADGVWTWNGVKAANGQ